jgi:hypothetical protein
MITAQARTLRPLKISNSASSGSFKVRFWNNVTRDYCNEKHFTSLALEVSFLERLLEEERRRDGPSVSAEEVTDSLLDDSSSTNSSSSLT